MQFPSTNSYLYIVPHPNNIPMKGRTLVNMTFCEDLDISFNSKQKIIW